MLTKSQFPPGLVSLCFNLVNGKPFHRDAVEAGGFTHLLTHLCARVGNEALEGDRLSRCREGCLSKTLHEWVDDSHRDLMPLLYFIQDLQERTTGGMVQEKALMLAWLFSFIF
jgi:hypothetical protein